MKLDDLAKSATNSSKEMACELASRIGVKKLIEIWERHQDDIQNWAKEVNAQHERDMVKAKAVIWQIANPAGCQTREDLIEIAKEYLDAHDPN